MVTLERFTLLPAKLGRGTRSPLPWKKQLAVQSPFLQVLGFALWLPAPCTYFVIAADAFQHILFSAGSHLGPPLLFSFAFLLLSIWAALCLSPQPLMRAEEEKRHQLNKAETLLSSLPPQTLESTHWLICKTFLTCSAIKNICRLYL